jgi:hypothetical protein
MDRTDAVALGLALAGAAVCLGAALWLLLGPHPPASAGARPGQTDDPARWRPLRQQRRAAVAVVIGAALQLLGLGFELLEVWE